MIGLLPFNNVCREMHIKNEGEYTDSKQQGLILKSKIGKINGNNKLQVKHVIKSNIANRFPYQ